MAAVREAVALCRAGAEIPTPTAFLGRNPRILQLLALARDAAQTDAPILITGESGCGKEVLAHAIHAQSRRRDKPYIAVNCGAIAGSLEESEMFGYVPGAFTGADQRKQGRFEAAHSGTIFLDEIGETSLPLQVKMLRVLQDGEYAPVGAAQNRRCDVRVVAATNRNLSDAVRQGAFRADLFYRLDVIRLLVPPLRERKEDIPLLAQHFARLYARRYEWHEPQIEASFYQGLLQYDYPGNVRELSNYVHRAMIASRGEPLSGYLLESVRDEAVHHAEPNAKTAAAHNNGAEAATPDRRECAGRQPFHDAKKKLIELFEREYLIAVLTECGGIIQRAAERAGLSERSFHAKLRQYAIDGTSFRAGALTSVQVERSVS